MMLHDKTIKTDLIQKVQNRMEEICILLNTEEVTFLGNIHTYTGLKLHHGYVYLTSEGGRLTYPRGVHGKTIVEMYKKLKERKVYTLKKCEGYTYKVRPKRK